MKTNLNRVIATVDDAKEFLRELCDNNEVYHPEDDAHDIIWYACDEPTDAEKDQLNSLMQSIYGLDDSNTFDPCGFIIDYDNDLIA